MGPSTPKDDDPTGEELALEFDGTKTDQLDASYRIRIALTSENATDDRSQTRSKRAMETGSQTTTGTVDSPRPLDDNTFDSSLKPSANTPTVVDKTAGYNPYDTIIEAHAPTGTIIEAEPPKGFVKKKRNVKRP
jgi:hypothetical protein